MPFRIKIPYVIASHLRVASGSPSGGNKSKAAGISVDSGASYQLKYNANGSVKTIADLTSVQTFTNKTLTSPVISNPTVSGRTPINITGSTVTLGATHVGRVATLSRAAGIAVTLPAATGSGDRYDLIVLVTFTGAASIAVANAQDYMIGWAQMGIDGGTFVPHQYPTANTGTVATESDTISMFGTANSQGGFKGERIILEDIAANIWGVCVTSDAGGAEATPFSAGV